MKSKPFLQGRVRFVLPFLALLSLPVLAFPASPQDWSTYLGDSSSSQYSTLSQINRDNAHLLEEAWRWSGGDADPDNRSQIQCNPLVIDGVLYGTSASLHLHALNAATGEELWEFDPFEGDQGPSGFGVNRGLAYWESGDDKRLLFGVLNNLYALDPATGKPIPGFGYNGHVDMRVGLSENPQDVVLALNTPGAIYRDLIIMGMRLREGPGKVAEGPIRAFNVRTGELVWTFNTIPRPGEYGYESWPEDAWQRIGGANVWTGMAVDEQRGMVFCPTGSAAFDFWGGDRLGDNLFANCLIALDANTGERMWHYQFVRHDLWDRDLPSPPNLVTVRRDGQEVPAVAQITKSGHVFVFHRETGEPLFPIEEVPVPKSDLIGEVTAATQPLPTRPAPFARQLFTPDLITDRTPEAHRAVLDQYVKLRPHVPFMPPSTEGTIIFPGFDGGGEWGGAATDPHGVLYVNANEMAWILTMVKISTGGTAGEQLYLQYCAGCHSPDLEGSPAHGIPSLVGLHERMTTEEVREITLQGKGMMPGFAFLPKDHRTDIVEFLLSPELQDKASARAEVLEEGDLPASPYTHTGYKKWHDPEGYPAVKPPWGTLHAIDLNTGDYRWSRRLGEFPELSAQGIPPTGAENYGGPIVTAGGLLFIAATSDEMFRIFDKESGELLWETKLPAGGYATPATYSVGGRQYVVVACGGGKMGTKSGDTYIAFALPTHKQNQ